MLSLRTSYSLLRCGRDVVDEAKFYGSIEMLLIVAKKSSKITDDCRLKLQGVGLLTDVTFGKKSVPGGT